MYAGGTVEMIWHFAGYLHLSEESQRARDYYDKISGLKAEVEFGQVQVRISGPQHELDPLSSKAAAVALFPGSYPSYSSYMSGFEPWKPVVESPVEPVSLPLPGPTMGALDGGISLNLAVSRVFRHSAEQDEVSPGPEDPIISVTYSHGELPDNIQINQINILLHGTALNLTHQDLELHYTPATADIIHSMIGQAFDLLPDHLARIADGDSIIETLHARHAELAASDGDGGHMPAPGIYVETHSSTGSAAPQTPASTGPGDHAIITGGNVAVNAAAILAYDEYDSSMIVMGDYFQTNAIIQANIYVDADTAYREAPGTTGALSSGANSMSNTAGLIEIGSAAAGGPVTTAGPTLNWNISVFEGDFINVKSISQTNYLSNDDLYVGGGDQPFAYNVSMGGALQQNLSLIADLGMKYDLIVVGGNYYDFNMIFQANVILDSDRIIDATTGGSAVAGSVSGGGNALSNDASIVNIGGDLFRPLDDQVAAFVDAIQNGASTLDWDMFWNMPGNGTGTFDVLYVTGNYYDIKMITQINVISDMDTLIALPGANGSSVSVQTASTGGNAASNSALIINADSTSDFQFLGGNYYQDTMLVQANIMASDDSGTTIYGNTDALISEVIAFIGNDEDGIEEILSAPVGTFAHDDVMGSVLT